MSNEAPVRNLVVPLDRSVLSERALGTARWLAKGLDADVRLITTTFGSDADADFEYLRSEAHRFGIDRVTPEIVLDQTPVAGIVGVVDSLPAAALVMAAHGQGVSPRTLGGVADEVIRRLSSPTVLIGPSCTAPTPSRSGTIVVALDGSDAAASILSIVAAWASFLSFQVHVATVQHSREQPCSDEQLVAAVEEISATGAIATSHRLIGADVARTLVAFAESVDADLLALSPTGHGGAMNRALGYVATEVAQLATIPLLVHRRH